MGSDVLRVQVGNALFPARLVFFTFAMLLAGVFFVLPHGVAHAAIIEAAPPIDGFFAANLNAGGGAIVPLARFKLSQASGTDTLSKIGLRIVASSTISSGEISNISLWQETDGIPDFQANQDAMVAGTSVSNPAVDGSQITLQPTTPVSISSTPTEFFIVASTTGVANITNGHALNIQLQANYASTTAGGVGSVFTSNKKIILSQSGNLKISQVQAGTATNSGDEWVELYNPGDTAIDLKRLPISLHIFDTNGSSSPKALTYYKTIIPARGFFLISSQTNYSGSTQADAVYTTLSGNTIAANTGVAIATSTNGMNATSSAIDGAGWGTQQAANCEPFYGSPVCASALTENGTSLQRLSQGWPFGATSTAATMAVGGVDSTRGNSLDNHNNSIDFISQANPNTHNSISPPQFPFGGGGTDTTIFQVMGSYPGPNQVNVPIDLPFIGFGFNKVVATGTIASATATTTVTLTPAAGGSNLCTSVAYNPFPTMFQPQAQCMLSAPLAANTSYTFTVTSAVRDLSGNALDQDAFTPGNQSYVATFTTGGANQTFTNVTPPNVIGTSPFLGSLNIPTNLARITIEFSQSNVDVTTLNAANITLTSPSSSVALSSFSFATSTGKNILSFTPGSLTANTMYTLTVKTGVKNTNNIALPVQYGTTFTTGSGPDTAVPTVVGVLPIPGTTITANTNDFVFTMSSNLDVTTATSGAVTLGIQGGANLPGTVYYLPVAKEGHFITQNVLPVGQTLNLTLKGASLKNVSGTSLGSDVVRSWTVEATNSDTSAPTTLFANADEFSVAVTFNKAVNTTDATTLANYSLTVGNVSQTLSALAGHSLTYDPLSRTAKLTGLHLTPAASFTITVQNIKDLSGNIMAAPSSLSGTVAAQSGGFIGPGSFSGSTFGAVPNFQSSGIGFMPPVNVHPMSNFVSATTSYEFNLPISKQIPANGTLVVTLPSSSDFGICCTATTSSLNPFIATINSDINGPGAGTIGIKTIAADLTAKTITLTIDTATRLENSDTHDFLHFYVANVRNPSIPKGLDSSGYTLDIKSRDATGGLLESFNANPIYITGGALGGGATTTIRGVVSGNGGNLQGVVVHMMSPQTGPIDATTDSTGLYQFTNVPVGTQFLNNNFGGGSSFMLFTDPFVNPTGTTTAFFGSTMPTPVNATSTSQLTRNFTLTATSSAINFTVNVTASANTFGAAENVDVFAGGPGQFVVRTVTPGSGVLSATTLTTIPIPQVNGFWNIGMGPSMPKGVSGGFSGPPPSPNWGMPKPIEVTVSGCPGACTSTVGGVSATSNTFTISTADKTLSGVVKDGSGNAISNAIVFAYSPTGGTGNSGQTSASGVFSFKVTSGSYNVSAFSQGVGKSREVPVVVDSSGNVFVDSSATASTGSTGGNQFILRMTKPSFTITGQVTDGTNPIGNVAVFAYRTDAPDHAEAMTDSTTGNYTLYVNNGTWKVNASVPGFGQIGEQTVTVSGGNQSNINFAPSSATTFSILSGNLYEDLNSNNGFDAGEGISGAIIRVSGSSGSNQGVTGNDGAFSIRVPSGTGYQIASIYSPTYGKIAPLKDNGTAIGTINLTASTTQNIRVAVRDSITINIKDSNGNLLNVPKAYIDLFDTSTQFGNRIEITNASSTLLLIASGTSPTIRAYIQGVPPANISVASDNANTSVSAGVLTVSHTTETVKVVVNTSTAPLSAVSGTVYKTSATSGNELTNAWIQFMDKTNGVQFGTQATSSGTYNLNISNGTYQVLVGSPGYISAPTTLVVSGTTTKNFVLTSASVSISGQVTAAGSPAVNAFVRAEKAGGGQAVTQTDANGNYTLNVTSGLWRVFAVADGYSEGAAASNPITVVSSSMTNANVALSNAVSLQSKLATSDTFSDTSASSFADSTVGVNVNLDANSLGSAGNSSYITARETSNVPKTSSTNLVGNKGKDISAFSGGSQVTNLQSGKKATVELSYTKSDLNSSGITTTSGVGNLKVVAYSSDKQDWEALSTIATYKDASGNIVASPASDLSNVSSVSFAAAGTHFSPYALSQPTSGTPPATPGGVTATAGSAGSGQITVSWTAVSGATGYFIYRDTSSSGSFPLLVDAGNTTTYTNAGVTNGTTYYYEVSAYSSSGTLESAASASVNANVATANNNGPVGGGGGALTPPAPPAVAPSAASISIVGAATSTATTTVTLSLNAANATQMLIANTSDFSSAIWQPFATSTTWTLLPWNGIETVYAKFRNASGLTSNTVSASTIVGPATDALLANLANSQAAAAALAVQQTPQATGGTTTLLGGAATTQGSITFTRNLSLGAKGDDIVTLQTFLVNQGFLDPSLPRGRFGAATKKALMRYQKSVGITPNGLLGPVTRAKISGSAAASASTGTGSAATTVVPSTSTIVRGVLTKSLSIGSAGNDVTTLQTFLAAQGSSIYPEGTVNGKFGPATKKAVGRFQMKYGIAKPGDAGYGSVGVKTRAQINALIGK